MSCNNCGTCYQICLPFQSCFSEMLVTVPVDYISEDIKIRISNGQGISFEQQAEVIGGIATIDLTLFPDGFFSAYGGPYSIQFFDYITLQLINFVAADGKNYNCITFTFVNGGSQNTQIVINIFGVVITNIEPMNNINYVAIALNEQQNQSDELTFLLTLQNS